MDAFFRQARQAVRQLARAPLFTLTAVLSLAVGIGANTAIFTAANAIFFAPTPAVRDMDRLVDIGRSTDGQGFDTVSFGTYRELGDCSSVFDGVYAMRLEPQAFSMSERDAGAERIYGTQVSASYFDVIGVEPALGTVFRSEEEQLGVPLRKVVLTHAFWQSRFGGRPEVVGQELILNGDPFVIVGVGPRGFSGTSVLQPNVWVPLTAYARGMPGDETLRGQRNVWLMMGARLADDVSIDEAQAGLDAFVADLRRDYPDVYERVDLVAAPASRVPGVGREYIAPFLGMLLGVTGLLLLVTCTNLAGLLLSRAASRSREVAVRLALGASRGALVGMLMAETLVVFGLGAAAALVIATWISHGLAGVVSSLPLPMSIDVSLDWRVLAFTAGVSLLAACLTGVLPALQSSRADLVPDLKADAGAPRRQRLRQVFIAAQLAASLVLIVTAGLFLRALGAAGEVEPGFDVDPIEVVTLDLALGGYTDAESPAAADEIRTRLAAIPGVEMAGVSRMVPLDGGGMGLGALRPAGSTGVESLIDTDWNVVSPEYFETLGIPVVRGRGFTPADRADAPIVAIVNERLAQMTWPGEEPIGKELENGDFRPGREDTIRTIRVVGVARGGKYRWLGEPPAPFIYLPYAQEPMRDVNVLLRRAGGAGGLALQTAVRDELRSFNASLPLVRMQPLRSYADLGLLPQRLAASIAASLGVLALVLAGIGVYGVTAFAVASRTREIGVRMALGADRARVMRHVLWQGARPAIIGGAVGAVLALGVTQLIVGFLFGVSPVDPVTYVTTVVALGAVTLVATAVPARRAAAVDPLTALRAE